MSPFSRPITWMHCHSHKLCCLLAANLNLGTFSGFWESHEGILKSKMFWQHNSYLLPVVRHLIGYTGWSPVEKMWIVNQFASVLKVSHTNAVEFTNNNLFVNVDLAVSSSFYINVTRCTFCWMKTANYLNIQIFMDFCWRYLKPEIFCLCIRNAFVNLFPFVRIFMFI